MRTCNSCGGDKPLSDYGRNKGMPDGLLKVCKQCMNAKQVARAKTPHGRALGKINGKKYRERNAEKVRQRSREYRERNLEEVRRRAREGAVRAYRADPSAVKAQTRAWRLKHPERRKAQQILNKAVARGEITPPKTCARCPAEPGRGADGRRLIQGHHHDYEKPLEVEWLCPPCHKVADAERVAIAV